MSLSDMSLCDPYRQLPAIFLDRDGVINDAMKGRYILTRQQFRFLPHVKSALAFLVKNFRGKIVIVTNQSPIGRGLISHVQVDALHTWMVREIAQAGGRVDAIYVCPHIPEIHCACRKPKSGLFLRAAQEMDLDLSRSIMVGDTLTDIQAAQAAGIRECYRVCTGLPLEDPLAEAGTYTIIGTLSEAALAIGERGVHRCI